MLHKRDKILVVDDERTIASLTAAILESQGYETATTYSGEAAVQLASSFRPDCVVSDIVMEAMTGVEAAIEILGSLPGCKVLFISGNADYKDHLKNARAMGFHFEVLEKPVSPLALLAKVAKILSDPADSNRKPAASQHLPCTTPRTEGA